ncbi:tannase [Cryomyces antarcticus]|uniref:Carboxylic ester hydrolase n=1 Tax=Cryomyces antarcticus TaxID=329879 RepID=A0ABR0M0A7_9PEZI|nr:tannase [Cryomyces antarcticus]
MQPGSELTASRLLYNGIPFIYTADWFKYAIYENPSYDKIQQPKQSKTQPMRIKRTPSISRRGTAISQLFRKEAANCVSFNSLLSSSTATQHPGPQSDTIAVHYHGLQDFLISSDNSPRYYNHVSTTMGLPSSDLDEFYRFFRISGMGHCYGGPGAWQIGQRTIGAAGNPMNAQNNILLRMVEWVENGAAPETVTGTKFVNDTASLGVQFIRNHCKYPKRNVCADPVNQVDPSAWKCV